MNAREEKGKQCRYWPLADCRVAGWWPFNNTGSLCYYHIAPCCGVPWTEPFSYCSCGLYEGPIKCISSGRIWCLRIPPLFSSISHSSEGLQGDFVASGLGLNESYLILACSVGVGMRTVLAQDSPTASGCWVYQCGPCYFFALQ